MLFLQECCKRACVSGFFWGFFFFWLLWLDPGVWLERFPSQLWWAAAWLWATHPCLVYLVDVIPCVPGVIEGTEDTVWVWTSFTSIEATNGWILHWVVWILWGRRGKTETNMEVCWHANRNLDCNQQCTGGWLKYKLLIYLWTGCELEKMQLFIHTEMIFCVARQAMRSANCALARWLNDRNECM